MANTLKFGNENWATKKDSILAYNDENANFKPLPFVTSRASTATRVNKAGLLETVASGIPRVDYLGNTKGAYLLEPQSTNLIAQSEAFSNSYWTKSGVSIAGGFASPSADTPLGAFKLVEDTSTGVHQVYRSPSSVNSVYSISIRVKKSERSKFRINIGNDTHYVDFDLSLGTITGSTGATTVGKIKALADDWYDCSLSYTESTGAPTYALIRLLDATGASTYTGNGTSGVYIFGAQLEQSSYPTSYIPTNGSTVTRLAESASQTITNGIINSSEGVLYFEGSYLDTDNAGYIELSDGGNRNRIIVWNISATYLRAFVEVGNVTQAQINGGSISSNNTFKFAFKYKTNDFALWVNGFEVATDTSGSTFGSGVLNRIDLSVPTVNFHGKVKDLRVYNTALTDAELAKLTTI